MGLRGIETRTLGWHAFLEQFQIFFPGNGSVANNLFDAERRHETRKKIPWRRRGLGGYEKNGVTMEKVHLEKSHECGIRPFIN